jgi:hypothetical protein
VFLKIYNVLRGALNLYFVGIERSPCYFNLSNPETKTPYDDLKNNQ